jgi:hypothetical protein
MVKDILDLNSCWMRGDEKLLAFCGNWFDYPNASTRSI